MPLCECTLCRATGRATTKKRFASYLSAVIVNRQEQHGALYTQSIVPSLLCLSSLELHYYVCLGGDVLVGRSHF